MCYTKQSIASILRTHTAGIVCKLMFANTTNSFSVAHLILACKERSTSREIKLVHAVIQSYVNKLRHKNWINIGKRFCQRSSVCWSVNWYKSPTPSATIKIHWEVRGRMVIKYKPRTCAQYDLITDGRNCQHIENKVQNSSITIASRG